MSYDISILKTMPTEVYEDNYTYNVSPMFRKALGGGGLDDLHDKKCADCIQVLKSAIKDMEENPDSYKVLNPPNKWGDYRGALTVLQNLLYAAEEHEDGVIRIH